MDICFGLGQFLATLVTEVSLRQRFIPTLRTFFDFFLNFGAAIHAEVGTSWKILATVRAFVDSYDLMAAVGTETGIHGYLRLAGRATCLLLRG